MWREYIESLTAENPNSKCVFARGAPLAKIEEAERLLAVELPSSLKELLQESNGIIWQIILHDGEEVDLQLIWSIEQMIEENLNFRYPNEFITSELSNSLLLFGSEGNGDAFAFKVTNGQISDENIFDCSHEDDSSEETSPSLREHLKALERFKAT